MADMMAVVLVVGRWWVGGGICTRDENKQETGTCVEKETSARVMRKGDDGGGGDGGGGEEEEDQS